MASKLKFFDLFSGVGGFRLALEKLGHICIGFSEIDENAVKTYRANFKTNNEKYFPDITKVTDLEIAKLDNFDILCAGFPCQSFSIMGNKLGMDDIRGTLFYDIVRILRIKKPRYFILENVRGLKTHDNGDTLNVMLGLLEKELDYNVRFEVLNSASYGVPQTRRRLVIIGDRDKCIDDNVFPPPKIKLRKKVKDILEREVDQKYFLSEKIKATILGKPTKNFRATNQTDLDIARPLCATMHKMHRACQDNYVTQKGKLRRLTPKEAFILQGFPGSFVDRVIRKFMVSDTQLYRQAGNAVTVNVVFAVAQEFLP